MIKLVLCVFDFLAVKEEHDHLRKQQEVLLKRLTQSDTTNEVRRMLCSFTLHDKLYYQSKLILICPLVALDQRKEICHTNISKCFPISQRDQLRSTKINYHFCFPVETQSLCLDFKNLVGLLISFFFSKRLQVELTERDRQIETLLAQVEADKVGVICVAFNPDYFIQPFSHTMVFNDNL